MNVRSRNRRIAALAGLYGDYEHDMNAVIDALGHDDVLVTFQPDQPLTVTIRVTSYGDDPRNPSFVASETDDEWTGQPHPTLQQLGAASLEAYLQWKQQQEGGECNHG